MPRTRMSPSLARAGEAASAASAVSAAAVVTMRRRIMVSSSVGDADASERVVRLGPSRNATLVRVARTARPERRSCGRVQQPSQPATTWRPATPPTAARVVAAVRARNRRGGRRRARRRVPRAPLRRGRRGEARHPTQGRRASAARRVGGRRRACCEATAPRMAALDDLVVARVLDDEVVRVKLWSATVASSTRTSPRRSAAGTRSTPTSAAAPRGWRRGRGQRPRPTRERARPRLGRPDRGVHAHPHPERRARAVRGLRAPRLGHRRRAPAPARARRTDPRRAAAHRPRAGAARLVAHAAAPARARGARGAARERDRRVEPRATAGRLVPPRRPRAGRRRSRLRPRPARRRRRASAARSPMRASCGRPSVQLRQNVRDLRTLLVDLHPPNLAATGLEAAVADLVSPLEAPGIDGDRERSTARSGSASIRRRSSFRVAQEAVRNVLAHADARAVVVELRRRRRRPLRLVGRGRRSRLRPRDEGPPRRRRSSRALAARGARRVRLGGRSWCASTPGEGTTVELEVAS